MKIYNTTFVLFTLLIFSNFNIQAQTLDEAVRYSFSDNIGSARMLGSGGAFGALGGEIGAILINPATAGTYQKGEFNISPMSLGSRTVGIFQGESTNDRNANDLNFFNMGAVFSNTNRDRDKKWKATNFVISLNKVSEFDQRFTFAGVSEGTIAERFAERANGLGLNELDDFEAGVAFDSEAIFDFEGDLTYSFDALPNQELQRMQVARFEGGINELAFTLGGNYKNQLQLGVTLAFPILNFSSTKVYEEEYIDDVSAFRGLEYTENLSTTGNGLNIKAGAIFTGIKPLRIGVSVVSPTRFNLNDEFSTSMLYTFQIGDDQFNGSASSPDGVFDYSYTTPWKFTGSLAYLLKTGTVNGFLSADIDYLDYRTSGFDLTSDGNTEISLEQDLNNQINNELNSAINIRLGAEIAYDIYRVRLGYGINASPYEDDNSFFNSLSGGFGFRFEKFFFDLGLRRTFFSQGYTPYVSLNENNVQAVVLDTRKTYIVSTFGIKF